MAWTKIKDGLFVGDRDSIQDYSLIEPNSITYFLNAAASELDFFWEGVEFLTFHWEDDPKYKCFDSHGIVLDQIVSFIDEGIRLGQSVLLYSTRGQSRCIGAACAYMMAKYGWGCDKVFEFFESKRVPMAPNSGLVQQLYELDWTLQRHRLKLVLRSPMNEETRERKLELNRMKLLTWQTGVGLYNDPSETDDLSADELVLVNSFVNGKSAFIHSHSELPLPPQGQEAKRHSATSLKWIDEPVKSLSSTNVDWSSCEEKEDAIWELKLANSKPILDINEAIEWIEDDPSDEIQSIS
mmetsp:Transcript_5590/g.6943  ORF Transcript_5590/g.6943 Transcript_5590/m.6943 type:complete len:296 (-) Transcript_5590:97-984(-)|eukprot:CAMPEP_0114348768 /NCGR_PEP_ID=MMETSP0101-20121206/14976_1 /TAXON_ID=38822 ORGANISM="Pteridomonas danica, Strain PT" /NCGR_SAMPLE_ID=MMETSP0101 /ASSEMBLY_ACC=CAM_ASM_000211 /LENGTH=295 /DNA_ID=CAMNT_0001486899 /DNA_START=82 /DNA_END=969 /DNA_ORIENTATION=+